MGAGHGVGQAQLEATAAKIRPTFDALPKNVYGHIGRESLRYLVHRYFASEHGWSIKGFEPHGVSMNTTEACVPKVLKQKLPSYIESILEHKLANHGFAAADVVTMVATLERIIFDEGVDILEKAYQMNGEKTSTRLSEDRVHHVMQSFMMMYAMQSERTNVTTHEEEKATLAEAFPEGWGPGDFAASETQVHLEALKQKNPFAAHSFTFDAASQAVSWIGEGFGKFQNNECKGLKDTLVSMDKQGTGRIALDDFYAGGDNTDWIFQETPDYLRNLGVLEEGVGGAQPSLLIPNYVLSMSNCMEPSDYYSICCLSECEGFLSVIEAKVRAPLVSPAEIATVVQSLLNSMDQPRNLTEQLRAKLDTVAEHHNAGKVPIHGRLFSQWLHYVFPHECPFPQKSDGHNPLTASEWMNQGKEMMLSDEEMEDFRGKTVGEEPKGDLFDEHEERPAGVELDLSQWTMDEELYVGHHHQGPRKGSSHQAASVQYVLGSLAKLGCVFGLFCALKQLYEQNRAQLGFSKMKIAAPSSGKDLFV